MGASTEGARGRSSRCGGRSSAVQRARPRGDAPVQRRGTASGAVNAGKEEGNRAAHSVAEKGLGLA